jgi:hypothetical protein
MVLWKDHPEEERHRYALLLVWLAQILAWSGDDLVSGTPRGWGYLLALGLLERCLAGGGWSLAVGLGIAACFYPPVAATMLPLTGVPIWRARHRGWSSLRQPLFQAGAAVVLCLLPVLAQSRYLSEHGPKVTLAEAQTMPEFQRGGRAQYFDTHRFAFWVTGSRSGVVARDTEIPWLILLGGGLFAVVTRRRLLPKEVLQIVGWLFFGGGLLFVAAHLFWFHLFHPSRYAQFVVLTGSTIVGAGLLGLCRWPLAWTLLVAICAANKATVDVPYSEGKEALRLAQKLQQTGEPRSSIRMAVFPGNELSATMPLIGGIPTLASIELSLPYHRKFYAEASQRISESLDAWSTGDVGLLRDFIQRYGVTHFYLDSDDWPDNSRSMKKRLTDPWRKRYATQLRENPQPLLRSVAARRSAPFSISSGDLLQEIEAGQSNR